VTEDRTSRRLDVAHVTATFPPYYAGTGNVAMQNALAVAELGHDVTVYTPRLGDAEVSAGQGVTVRRLRPLVRVGNASLVPGLLLMPRHDVVHLHYPFIFGAESLLVASRLRRFPFVLTYHNDLLAPGFKGGLFDVYQRVWSRSVLRGARVIITPDLDGAGASAIAGPIVRARGARTLEIPNGVDVERFRPMFGSNEVRRRLGLDGDAPVILFVGAMDSAHHPKGGVPVLLEAMLRLSRRDVHVLLVGGGDRVAEYRRLAMSLGLADRTLFAGQVPHDEMPAIYSVADIVVQPSQLFEPFGLVSAEAMACGRPVVASDLPGIRRVVSLCDGGVLARAGDAGDLAARIDQLLDDGDLRAELGRRGRIGVEQRYDARRIGPLLEEAYVRAIGSRRSRH
jgi:glycosyltransferase involved in cell wall biosynthesis